MDNCASARTEPRKINRYQVCAVMDALEELQAINCMTQPRPDPQTRHAVKVGILLQIMRVLDMEFADKHAAGNALASLREFNDLRGVNAEHLFKDHTAPA